MNQYTLGDWRVVVTAEDSPLRQQSTYPSQVHGEIIIKAEQCEIGKTNADGIRTSGLPVSIITADCMPLVIVSREQGLVLHVSRKTLVRGLLEQVAEYIHPPDITHIFIGPHICEEHFVFEYRGNELAAFQKKFQGAVTEHAGIHLSLQKATRVYFDRWHIPAEIITQDERCTFETENLTSYRRWLQRGMPGTLFPHVATVLWRQS